MTDEIDEEIAPWDLLADALGSLQDIEEPEEDLTIDVLEGQVATSEDDPYHKVPLEKAKNLLKLRRCVDAVVEGRMSKQDFLNSIRPMARSLENGLKLAESPAVRRQLDELSDEEYNVFLQAQDSIELMHSGMKRMLRYKETDDLQDVEEGMNIVENCFEELDEVQDEAIELGQELEEVE